MNENERKEDIIPVENIEEVVEEVDIDYKVNERSKSTSITYKIRNK